MDQWLAHPRHQGVQRDIGELLDATEYEDDLDLLEGSELGEDELTQEDIDFLDDSSVVDGFEDGGSESYGADSESGDGVDLSLEAESIDADNGNKKGTSNEADTSLEAEAVPTDSSDSDGESEASAPVPSTRAKRPRAPRVPHPATPSPKPRSVPTTLPVYLV